MSTTTYEPIATVTVSSANASVLVMNSIPATYTDLILVCSAATSSGANALYMRFNNDSSSIYSTTYMYGNGSSAASGAITNRDAAAIGYFVEPATGSAFNSIAQIQNYANTNTFKTVIDRANSTTGTYPGAEASVSLWRSTSAINRIDVLVTSNTISVGSTFTLYGISNAGDDSPKANGGDVYSDATYWYHVFPMSGNFVPNQSLSADVLCIAGGGGGAGASGGGGGAGGIIYFASQSLTAQRYPVIVGGGGAKGNETVRGSNGGNSQFASLTVASGGGGGGTQGGTPSGLSGGSGGGGTYQGAGGGSSTQSGSGATASYGNAGGGGSSTDGGSGGGGGAGGAGGNGNSTGPYYSGDGGIGTTAFSSWGLATNTGENISGTVYYAGGGGGGTNNGHTKPGGLGGGGGDGFYNTKYARNALPATGGGGYGAGISSGTGGSGLVIVRYLK
jgi:hypothetical protein